MAANTGSESTGRKNYYGVAYGKLSTKVKDIPEGYSEITEADLKSKTQAVEQIDLRKKYINKGKGDYPYQVFYDSITGVILEQEKFENDNGTSLNLTVLDKDGDTSIIQVKFYSKYNENLLNRLLNSDTTKEFTFFPYAISNTADFGDGNKSFYTQGVSLKVAGTKIEPKYADKSKDAKSPLPSTEQVKVQGKMSTSRDNRLDFLYEEFLKHFKPSTESPQPKVETKGANVLPPQTAAQAFPPAGKLTTEKEIDDLPF
jgi:hypothetical protein